MSQRQTPEARKASTKKYRENNRDAVRESSRRYSQRPEVKAKRLEYQRAWRAANQDKIREYTWKFTQRRRGAGLDVRSCDMARVLRCDPCSYCGGPGGEIDHIVPVTAGGTAGADNLTAACRRCNARKYNKPMLLWMATDPQQG